SDLERLTGGPGSLADRSVSYAWPRYCDPRTSPRHKVCWRVDAGADRRACQGVHRWRLVAVLRYSVRQRDTISTKGLVSVRHRKRSSCKRSCCGLVVWSL